MIYIITEKYNGIEEPIAAFKNLKSALKYKNKKFRKVSFNVFPYIYQISEGENSFYIYSIEVQEWTENTEEKIKNRRE